MTARTWISVGEEGGDGDSDGLDDGVRSCENSRQRLVADMAAGGGAEVGRGGVAGAARPWLELGRGRVGLVALPIVKGRLFGVRSPSSRGASKSRHVALLGLTPRH